MARNAVASALDMGRKPSKPKKGEPFRLHVVLPGELVLDVDDIAAELKAADAYRRPVTRTDAIYELLTEAIAARKQRK